MIAWEQLLAFLALGGAILSAVVFGQAHERIVAATMAIAALLSWLLSSGGFLGPEANLLAVDFALFLVMGAVALLSAKLWPLLACGFHMNALFIHAASFLPFRFAPGAYADSLVLWSHLACLSLAIGAWWERPVRSR
ncbi:hypothetical protein [Thermaurantiacus sp.]